MVLGQITRWSGSVAESELCDRAHVLACTWKMQDDHGFSHHASNTAKPRPAQSSISIRYMVGIVSTVGLLS